MADYSQLAKAMAAGGATGAATGALAGFPHGAPGMISGAQGGLVSGLAGPLLRQAIPNPDAAALVSQYGLMPFPLNVPPLVGAALIGMGAKPTSPEQMLKDDARDLARANR